MKTLTTAAPNQKQFDDLIRLMYAAVISVSDGQAATGELKAQTIAWSANAAKFEKQYDLPELTNSLREVVADPAALDDVIDTFRSSRQILKQMQLDREFSHEDIDILKASFAYLLTKSDRALQALVKMAPRLHTPLLSAQLKFDAGSQNTYNKPLQKIVWAVAKRKNSNKLTKDEAEALREKNPEVYKEYLRLRRGVNDVWKTELRNFVFDSGKPIVDYQAALKFLQSQGLEHTLPPQYRGKIDANGALYTTTGKPLAGGLPSPGFTIKMNPDYDPKTDDGAVFMTINDETDAVSKYVYTQDFVKRATKSKLEKVKKLDTMIDNVRKKWMMYVKQGGKSPQAVCSTVLELLYLFGARIGDKGNTAKGKTTYGLSTILVKHVKVSGANVVIGYNGKDGVRQVHKLDGSTPEGKILVRNIKILLHGKQPNDQVFTFDYGDRTDIPANPKMINDWFHKLGIPQGVTVHKLRHVQGSRLFRELMDQNAKTLFERKVPLTQTQGNQAFVKLAEKVGQLLGHIKTAGGQAKVTGMTALKSYIDPEAQLEFWSRANLRPPKYLEKMGKNQGLL
jgi:hypothetical protein